MVVRLNQDKDAQKIENEEGKKASRTTFLSWYRKFVPGILSKLPDITVRDWKDAINEVDNDVNLGTSIKQLLISAVSPTKYCDFLFSLG